MFSNDSTLNWEYWHSRVQEGQHDLSLLSRKIIYNIRPDIFEQLPFEDDAIFLEPLFFSAFASPAPREEIESLAVRYFHNQHAPFKFTVKPNADGMVVIPEIGSQYAAKNSLCLQSVGADEKQQPTITESIDTDILSFATEPKTADHKFSIYNDIHYLLYPLFKFVDGTVGSISKKNLAGIKHLALVERSLKHISIAYPDYYAALTCVTRGFMIFRQPRMNSFSSESAHGISFLSVPDFVSIPYFVEDIAHQCGHIVFSSIFFRPEELLALPSETPISSYNQNPDDNRSLYVVFHAVFTEHLIATCLLSLYGSPECSDEENDEIIGRLAFIMKKYHRDLDSLGKVPERTENGEMMYNELESSYRNLHSKCARLIKNVNLTEQPYNFDFIQYKKANLSSHIYV